MSEPWDEWPHDGDDVGDLPGPDPDGHDEPYLAVDYPHGEAYPDPGDPADGFDDPDLPGADRDWSADTPLYPGPDPHTLDPSDPDLPGTPQAGGWPDHGGLDAPLGADPDLDGYEHHESWPAPLFPPPLDLAEPPEPVDGPPWADPALLGPPEGPTGPQLVIDEPPATQGHPEPAELADYLGLPPSEATPTWSQLIAAEDPATSALARFWAPTAE